MELVIGGVVVLVLLLVIIYNGLIGKKNQVENSFATIDVMLKKRSDLIPNLIASVKEYMKHESAILNQITELRTNALSEPLNSDQKVEAENKISQCLGSIRVAVENYPELKADQSFQSLMKSLNEVEEQLSAARRSFNASVTDYNNSIEMFPSNLMANAIGYKRRQLFEIPENARENIDVAASFNS